ncbi:uncharacterized protein LOC100874984 [Megachile rotundata]|uniref:uncharacterized protein LOC100874984 n=1 Tax=Megachile rotundata TaxID=143995 RepID=UPI000258F851
MLEPLIVLTVLNCFFMFSSTVTTCALWWQYRSHRCCFKKDTTAAKHDLSKMKTHPGKSPKRNGNGRQESVVNGADRNRSNSTVHRDSRSSRRNSRQKSKSNTKYLLQDKIPNGEDLSSIFGSGDLEETARMSEASQTVNDTKSAVVMEYSTVQKIVQILEDDVDLSATRMAIKEFNNKHHHDDKKLEQHVEEKFETVTVHVPVTEERFDSIAS